MKKMLLPICAVMCLAQTAFADDVKILKDGKEIECDVRAYADENGVMVPLRAVFEAMGMSVNWQEEKKTIIAVNPQTNDFAALQIGSETAFLGEETVSIIPVAKIMQNRTFVPVEFIADNFSEDVQWGKATYTLTIR